VKVEIMVDADGVLGDLEHWRPERFIRAWATAIKNLAANKARAKSTGKGGFW